MTSAEFAIPLFAVEEIDAAVSRIGPHVYKPRPPFNDNGPIFTDLEIEQMCHTIAAHIRRQRIERLTRLRMENLRRRIAR